MAAAYLAIAHPWLLLSGYCCLAIVVWLLLSAGACWLPMAACKKEFINVTLVTDVFLTLYKLKTLALAGVFSVQGQRGSLF
ncbi:hypothetical protein [Desulfovibrio sp. 86]|nr:hypothetical protein [Desulfovibrio sp. 86]